MRGFARPDPGREICRIAAGPEQEIVVPVAGQRQLRLRFYHRHVKSSRPVARPRAIIARQPRFLRVDGTADRVAYRCTPLSIANSSGWENRSPCAFEATWTGGPATGTF